MDMMLLHGRTTVIWVDLQWHEAGVFCTKFRLLGD
jgi:hypothetical protein